VTRHLLHRRSAAGHTREAQPLRSQRGKKIAPDPESGAANLALPWSVHTSDVDARNYRCPNGLSPLGRHEHGPFKHGPRTTLHGPRASVGLQSQHANTTRHDQLQRPARGRHDSCWIRAALPLLSLIPASPPLLYKGERFLYVL
jgi:hypothetical protein